MKTLLLIEDDKIMRENTAEMLELAGYKVLVARDGREGVKVALAKKPELILCDIMMPELDGHGVLSELSATTETSDIPFIFLTAKAEKSDVRQGMNLGADDYLTKPFDETDLLQAIEARFKKWAALNQNFTRNAQGLNQFFQEARKVGALSELIVERSTTSYKKKQVIFHEGDQPQFLYFVDSGKVKCFKTHDEGKDFVTDIYEAGQFFGLPFLFEQKPYSETALALEPSELVKVPLIEFQELLFKNREISKRFIKLLSQEVKEKEQQLLSLAYDSVRKRVAAALLRFGNRSLEKEKLARLRLTREDLASMVGTATETLIRCLSEFKEEGLIEGRGREIVISDLKLLEQVS